MTVELALELETEDIYTLLPQVYGVLTETGVPAAMNALGPTTRVSVEAAMVDAE